MAVIDELLVKLGIDYDSKEVKNFNKGLDEIGRGVRAIGRAAIVTTVALSGMTKAMSAGSYENGKLSESLGLNEKAMMNWSEGIELMGNSSEGVRPTFGLLQTDIENVRDSITQTGVVLGKWGQLADRGIFINWDAVGDGQDLIEQLQKQMEGMAPATQKQILESVGIVDKGMQRIIMSGSANTAKVLKQAQDSVGANNEEFIKASKSLNSELAALKVTLTDTFQNFVITIAPQLEEISKELREWLADPETKKDIEGWAISVGNAFGVIADVLKWIVENKDAVSTAVTAMIAAFAVSKLASIYASVKGLQASLAAIGSARTVAGINSAVSALNVSSLTARARALQAARTGATVAAPAVAGTAASTGIMATLRSLGTIGLALAALYLVGKEAEKKKVDSPEFDALIKSGKIKLADPRAYESQKMAWLQKQDPTNPKYKTSDAFGGNRMGLMYGKPLKVEIKVDAPPHIDTQAVADSAEAGLQKALRDADSAIPK